MKRSGFLKRKTPLRPGKGLKRTSFKRKVARPNPAGSDKAHLAWVRKQPCCVCASTFGVQAHHSTVGKGLSQKNGDRETMPLCFRCHRSFHDARGFFDGWNKADRKRWQERMVTLFAPGEQTV